MIDIILITLGSICLIVGLLGCILPIISGPPISYIGLLLLHITDRVQFSTYELLLWLLAVVIAQLLDYFIPIIGSRYSGGAKWRSTKDAMKSGIGALLGFLLGTILKVVICGYFIGCFIEALM